MPDVHFEEWIAARYEILWPELFEPVAARHRDPAPLSALWRWIESAGRRTGEAAGPGHVAVTRQVELIDLLDAPGADGCGGFSSQLPRLAGPLRGTRSTFPAKSMG